MNLHYAQKAVFALQEILGLNLLSVPEIEFRAELPFIAKYFSGDNDIQLRQPEDDTFKNSDDPAIPSLTILAFPDTNGTNVAEGNVLKFTYYGGSGSPAGPRHGLVIDLLPKGQRLYWRRPGYDIACEWEINSLADGNGSFQFTPYVSDRSWMSHDYFYTLMQKYEVIDFLKVDKSAQFLAETTYLSFWNAEHNDIPSKEGIDIETEFHNEDGEVIITISCRNRPGITQIILQYDINQETNRHGLAIYEICPNFYDREDNDSDDDYGDGVTLVYDRDSTCDESTGWFQNCMANDPLITDENGEILFKGEPIQD